MSCLRIVFLFFLLGFTLVAHSQVVFLESGRVFDDSEVARVDIDIDEGDLDKILDPNNERSDIEYPATFYYTKNNIIDTIYNVGFRLRGNTSRAAAKKSYKVSFNSFEKGQKFYNLEKLNLNGEHNDPSIMRSKICWDLYRLAGIPSSRASHAALYINDVYYGLYINVEHIDEQFIAARFAEGGNLYKCLWPADLSYRGTDPSLYALPESWGRQAYDLKTNELANDYSDIANFINILNNTSDDELVCSLEEVFEVDDYLRVIAMDILVSNWDGPIVNKNNFYLYYNPETGKFHYIPFDLDNTLGIDFFGIDWPRTNIYSWAAISGESRPIYDRLMSIPAYKDKMSHYMQVFVDQFFNRDSLSDYILPYRELLAPHRQQDTFAELDYGFKYNDFYESFTLYKNGHVAYGIIDYAGLRVSVMNQQIEQNAIDPYLEELNLSLEFDTLTWEYAVQYPGELEQITLWYRTEEGDFMPLAPQTDSTFSLVVDGSVDQVDYFFELENLNGKVRSFPFCEYHSIAISDRDVPNLVINEFVAKNDSGLQDPAGEFDDWIEIYNNGNSSVVLSDVYLSDDPDEQLKWRLPKVALSPQQYYLVWADNDEEQGVNHANFKLAADGETLTLSYRHLGQFAMEMDQISYGEQTTNVSLARIPNATGDFVPDDSPTPRGNNELISNTSAIEFNSTIFYPNPTSDLLHFRLNKEEYDKIEIIDIQNRVVKAITFSASLDVSNLQSGIYYVKLLAKDHITVSKFLKL